MRRSLFAVSVLLVVASGCASTHEEAAVSFVESGRTALSCPQRRVRSTEEAALAMPPPPGSFRPTTPWVEPEPFAGVASDPQRLRLWRATVRDPAYLQWQQESAVPDAQMKEIAAAYEERRVFAARGCGSTALYACSNGHHACSALEDTEHVFCRNGGALRTMGSGETMRFACDARAETESPAPLAAVSVSKDIVASDLADHHLKEQLDKVEAELAHAAP